MTSVSMIRKQESIFSLMQVLKYTQTPKINTFVCLFCTLSPNRFAKYNTRLHSGFVVDKHFVLFSSVSKFKPVKSCRSPSGHLNRLKKNLRNLFHSHFLYSLCMHIELKK